MNIRTVFDFNRALFDGPYAWPGGYPIYFVCSDDGEALSFDAAKAEAPLIRQAIIGNDRSGWRVIGSDINWEDGALHCAHTNERIESAYAD